VDEREWLTCAEPDRMLKFLGKKYSPRKLRLFAVACCRKVWHLLEDASRRAVEVAERYADGRASERELDEAGEAAWDDGYTWEQENPAVWVTLHDASKAAVDASAWAAGLAVGPVDSMGTERWEPLFDSERARQAHLFRDIVRNPFRPAILAPQVRAWQGGTVVRMAQAIYDEGRFVALPILADALEEAGGDSADIVTHCRDGREHVRGCWVLDLLRSVD